MLHRTPLTSVLLSTAVLLGPPLLGRTTAHAATYKLNAKGEVVEITEGGTTTTLAYSATGKLAAQTSGGVTTSYVYDDSGDLPQVIAEVRSDGKTILHAYGPAGYVASIDGSLVYPLSDEQGTARAFTDEAGAVIGTAQYDAWGKQVGTTGVTTRIGYTGELTLPSGAVWLRARTYDPNARRFVERDDFPGDGSRPSSLNRFSYVEGDPINQADPTGNQSEAIGKLWMERARNGYTVTTSRGKKGKISMNPANLSRPYSWVNDAPSTPGGAGFSAYAGVGGGAEYIVGSDNQDIVCLRARSEISCS